MKKKSKRYIERCFSCSSNPECPICHGRGSYGWTEEEVESFRNEAKHKAIVAYEFAEKAKESIQASSKMYERIKAFKVIG